jgi:hypothetical protein
MRTLSPRQLFRALAQQGVDAFRGTERLSDGDKGTLMGGALQRVYRWSPRTA